MLWVWFLVLCLVIVVGTAARCVYENRLGATATLYLIAFVVLLFIAFVVAPDQLGLGKVPDKAEEFTKRLTIGKVYQLIAFHQYSSYEILLVRERGSENYHAIRVNAGLVPLPKPGYFILDNSGQLVEVK